MFDEIKWLEEAGHEVAHFSTTHPRNEPSIWADDFVPYFELGLDGGLSASQRLTAGLRLFSNHVAAQQFKRVVDRFHPDVVHAHGIHRQISTSILAVAKARRLPVVHSLHDYHLSCPADVLLYQGRSICQPRRCGNLWFGPCVAGRCVKGSLAASALSAAETAWSRALRRYSQDDTRFICPSDFMRRQMLEAGWRVSMDVIPNAVPLGYREGEPGDFFLVIGRLSREKGVEIAAEAARLAGKRLVVAGDGPLSQSLEAAYPEVSFTGHLSSQEVHALTLQACAVVVPSLWYENAPMSVLEPMAAGVPVIASSVGGIPEQVTDGVDGLLVKPGDIGALSEAMKRLSADRDLATARGSRAQVTMAERFSPEKHVTALVRTYTAALTGDERTVA